MSILFDPTKEANKIASKTKIKKLLKKNFSLKKTVLSSLASNDFKLNKGSLTDVALKTIKSYEQRLEKLEGSEASDLKKDLVKNPKLLINRVQNELIFQIHTGIKKKYKGQRARWLPSDADEPRPEHQANYGKIYTIGEGINGVEPGDEYGCKCGVEILTDDDELDLT